MSVQKNHLFFEGVFVGTQENNLRRIKKCLGFACSKYEKTLATLDIDQFYESR